MVHVWSSGNIQIFDLTDSGRQANPVLRPLPPSSHRQLTRLLLLPALLGRRQSQPNESPQLQRTLTRLSKWPCGGTHSCFEGRGMCPYPIPSLGMWDSKHSSCQRQFPLKPSFKLQFLDLSPIFYVLNVDVESKSHRLNLGLSPL